MFTNNITKALKVEKSQRFAKIGPQVANFSPGVRIDYATKRVKNHSITSVKLY